MNRHLIAIEVGIEGGAHERVQTDCLALDQHRIEGLNPQPVQRRRTVQEDRVFTDHLVQHVPDFRTLLLDQPFGALDGRGGSAFLQLMKDEGLEELQRHLFGQPALVETKFRTHHDHRPP